MTHLTERTVLGLFQSCLTYQRPPPAKEDGQGFGPGSVLELGDPLPWDQVDREAGVLAGCAGHVSPVQPVVVGAGHKVRTCSLTEAVACIQVDIETQEEVLCLGSHGGRPIEVLLALGKAQCLTDPGQHQVICQPGCEGLQITVGEKHSPPKKGNTHTSRCSVGHNGTARLGGLCFFFFDA